MKQLNGCTAAQKTGQTGQTGQTTVPQTGLTTSRTVRLDDGDENMSDDEQFEDAVSSSVGVTSAPSHPLPPPSQQLASTMGLSTHDIQVMKASFFGGEEFPSHPSPSLYLTGVGKPLGVKPTSRPSSRLDNHQSQFRLLKKDAFGAKIPTKFLTSAASSPDQSFVERTDRTAEATKQPFIQKAPFPPQPAPSLLQAQSAALMAKHNLHTLVPLEKSLVRGRSRLVADASLFMGRSFRVGWGPNWTLVHSGFQVSPEPSTTSTSQLQQPLFTVVPSGAAVLSSSSSSSTLPLRVVVERLDVSPAMKPELREERGVEVSASRHVYPGAVEGQRSHLALQ